MPLFFYVPMTKAKKHQLILAARKRRKLAEAQGMYSLDINTGVEKLRPEDLLQREVPGSRRDAFVRARAWHRDNWFVEQVHRMTGSFFNYGLEIKPAEKGKAAKNKLEKILNNPKDRADILRFIDSTWSEWNLLDTVVAFWRSERHPFLLLPEACNYSDAFGIEKLWVTFKYEKSDLADDGKTGVQGLDPSLVRRYSANKENLLSEAHDEYFKVLTRGLKGQGFGWPRLRRVFRTLSQNESMEIGEFMYAMAGRLIIREHQIGFEVKSSANAMRQGDYLWKKPRANAMLDFYKGHSAGLVETVEQFDHALKLHWTDPKLYDAAKWESIVNRLLWWAGPPGFMMMAKGTNPYLLQMFEVNAQDERIKVGAFCEHVLSEGFGIPCKLSWSNRCFRDMRLAWDMVKFFTQQGPLSLTTGLREAGFDPEEEAELKRQEAKEDRRDELFPLFDQSHGQRPGEPDGPGRPPVKATSGKKD